jgi:hypothetical protein
MSPHLKARLLLAFAAIAAATGACSSFGSAVTPDGSAPAVVVEGGADAFNPPLLEDSGTDAAGDAGVRDRDAASQQLMVFVTVSSYADVTTAAAADAKCHGEAAGRLTGNFVAWYPKSAPPAATAAERLVDSLGKPVDGPWFRPDGRRVVSSRAALSNTAVTPLENAIAINAAGAPASGSVWTGTLANGNAGVQCPGLNPTKGLVTSTGPDWTDTGVFTATCGSSLFLYCFQVE